MEPAYKLLSVEEFLDTCPSDQRHYELIGGVIVAMAPPGTVHQAIAGRLSGEIYAALEVTRRECFLLPQAGIAPHGLSGRDHFETDLTVSCSPLDREVRGIVAEPLLIVEILSPSTERNDIFVKLPSYEQIASLQEILFIETQRIGATVHRRANTRWVTTELEGPDDRLQLRTVGLDIPLGHVYRGIPGLGA